MPKVDLDTRLEVLHEISEIFENKCNLCPYNAQNSRGEEYYYCRYECSVGQDLIKLGERYNGFKFNRKDVKSKGRPTVQITKDQCIELCKQGFSQKEMAKKLGVGITTIRNKFHQWGISFHQIAIESELNKIIELFKKGYTQSEIANQLDLGLSRVHRRLKSEKLI